MSKSFFKTLSDTVQLRETSYINFIDIVCRGQSNINRAYLPVILHIFKLVFVVNLGLNSLLKQVISLLTIITQLPEPLIHTLLNIIYPYKFRETVILIILKE